MGWHPVDPDGWPTAEQSLLTRAAILDGAEAVAAWREWRAVGDLASVDAASFFLLPQLFRNLGRCGLTGPDLATLGSVYRYSWTQNQLLLRSLASVLAILQRAGVATMVLKGVPLALFYYQDIGARMMSDADVLIRERDIEAGLAALREAGWRIPGGVPASFLGPALSETHISHPRWGVVDLHWRLLFDRRSVTLGNGWWERALESEILGLPSKIQAAEDLMLTMLVSSRKLDPQAVSRWVVDAVMIARPGRPLDWLAVVERAADCGLLLPLRDTLGYLDSEFSGIVPAEALREAMSKRASRDDVLRYQRLKVFPLRFSENSIRGALTGHWRHYAGISRDSGVDAGTLGFMRYLLWFYRYQWNARALWQMLFLVPYRALRRIVRGRRSGRAPSAALSLDASGLASRFRVSDSRPAGDAARPP